MEERGCVKVSPGVALGPGSWVLDPTAVVWMSAHLAEIWSGATCLFERFVSTNFLCNNQCRQRSFNLYTKRYTALCVKSKRRHEEPTARTYCCSMDWLRGMGGRAAAAAAAVGWMSCGGIST